MSIASLVAAGRRAAEAMMVDEITFYDKDGRAAQNETTGAETQEYAVAFVSKCKFQTGSDQQPQTPSVGGRRDAIDELSVHLPFSAPQVSQGQVGECTAVGTGSDPRLLGRRWVVSVPMNKSFSTATRLRLKELP